MSINLKLRKSAKTYLDIRKKKCWFSSNSPSQSQESARFHFLHRAADAAERISERCQRREPAGGRGVGPGQANRYRGRKAAPPRLC